MKLFEKAEPGESVQVDVKYVPIAGRWAFQYTALDDCTIRPRRPQQNGKVERSHRIDQEEFWGRHRFQDFDAVATALREWGGPIQSPTLLPGAPRAHTGRKTRCRPAIVAGRLDVMLCHQKPPVSLDETKQSRGRLI